MRNWQKAEQRSTQIFPSAKGRLQPGSGNRPGLKGDTRFVERVQFTFDRRVLMEVKQTDKESLSVKGQWLDTISVQAAQLGRVPLLWLTIGKREWLALPAWAVEDSARSTVNC